MSDFDHGWMQRIVRWIASATMTLTNKTIDLYNNTLTLIDGNWTPTASFVTNGNFSPTYNIQEGRYRRYGDLVWCAVHLVFNSNAYTTASGGFRLGGLPFTSVNDSNIQQIGQAPLLSNVTLGASDRWVNLRVENNDTKCSLLATRSATTGAQFTTANFPASTNNLTIRAIFVYLAQ